MKYCHACGLSKSLSEFSKNRAIKSGYQTQCKSCMASAGKKWVEKNKDHVKDSAKRNYQEKRDERLEKSKLWYEENKEDRLKSIQSWQANNFEKVKKYQKDSHYQRNYGVSFENVTAMILDQQNKCAICKTEMLKPNVDHCHASGKVRGILCGNCNRGIGLLKESVQTLENAIHYLKTHS